ncbi:Nuclear factor NF-kappa-B subunit [Toxocara canis]|uniref:Nuclear factor NF-kappa-B subunit n=1 Tax=Toxocara canis TaxID=6265 RepID=A0A0B2VZ30_TOXCA|nr:Nuclear factor NF-kappa-B subunit [Toxocara canis]
MSSSSGTCLVARAMPCALPPGGGSNCLADKLSALSVSDKPTDTTRKKNNRLVDGISPADFVTLQSLRSSALARKTNTTSKIGRGGAVLFSDLINNRDRKKVEGKDNKQPSKEGVEKKKEADEANTEGIKKNEPEKEDETKDTNKTEKGKDGKEEEHDDELLSRGPVRSSRTSLAHHPYTKSGYGAAPQSAVDDYSAYTGYGSGYECGNSWADSPEMIGYISSSSTPDTVQSDLGYQSPSPQLRHSPFIEHNMSNAELNRLLDATKLPDALSDFILKYSRRYSASSPEVKFDSSNTRNYSRKNSTSESIEDSPKHRPMSADSGCDSPMSAGSAPQNSPSAPRGATSGPPTPDQFQSQTGLLFHQTMSRKVDGGARTAKDRLRSLINDSDMSEAWAWTCKCVQYFPGALCYQDPDRDSLLHIVTLHMDLAKIYALVEQMLKTDFPPSQKPFDMPNRLHETPLFLAVEKRCVEVVAYLLEAGAYPNNQTQRPERDAPLHYAAARGMTEIVETLCAHPGTDINLVNGMGLTPLLCAVNNHGVIEEESQSFIDNTPTIRALLKSGADPLIPDATNGKTVIHYAVDRMEPNLIEGQVKHQ